MRKAAEQRRRDPPQTAEREGPADGDGPAAGSAGVARPREIGGPKGPEPTRYGDWEKGGRCTDF